MRLRHLMILTLLLTLALTTGAQPEPWQAVLYDGLSGRLLVVDRDGTLTYATTLTSRGTTTLSQQIAVSPNAAHFAYVTYGEPSELVIFERTTNTGYNIGMPTEMTIDSLSFIAGDEVFSPDGSRFAFGYALADGTWQVTLYEQATEWSPVATLDNSATFPEMAPVDALGRTPIVSSINADGTVTVILAEPFSGYAANFEDVYTWDPVSGALTRQPLPATLDVDRADGAQITTVFDPAYANNADAFPYPQANALYLTEPDGSRRLLFNTSNLSLFWPRFVGNGTAVWVGGYSPQNRLTWFLLDRTTGDLLTSQFPPVQMTDVAGTPEGFVYTVEAGANAGTLLNIVPYDNGILGEPVQIWAGEADASYRVVWAG